MPPVDPCRLVFSFSRQRRAASSDEVLEERKALRQIENLQDRRGIVGFFVGPVIGAIAGEFVAGKRMIDAGRAGWGSLLGNLGAMVGKLVIALAMIAIFFLTVPTPF